MAVCGPGDEVVIPAPYWVSYSDLVKLTGATPIIIPTTEASGFKLLPNQLRAAINPRTKLVMINSPSNPTGVVYHRSELEALADVILETDAGVLSDEIYEQLTYGDAHPTCFATLRPVARSNDHRFGGQQNLRHDGLANRLGRCAAEPVAQFMGDIQSQETSNPCSVSQWAALEAVAGPQDSVAKMKAEFQKRRDYVMARIRKLPGSPARRRRGRSTPS